MVKYSTYPKAKVSTYVAKTPDEQGYIHYTETEHQTWAQLYAHQIQRLPRYVCPSFMRGLDLLQLPSDRIPQCEEISTVLRASTGFEVAPVSALIPDEEFFRLLSERKFPAATFIRRQDELNYLQEPDLFHEYFGHCPMFTDSAYADFSQAYGEHALAANTDDRALLARLYWFTIEFGLLKTEQGFRAYGGGIISSPGELAYSVEDERPERHPLTTLEVLRTPYRIDQMQPIYFYIKDYQDLYKIMDEQLPALISEAHALGDFEPTFPTEDLL